MTSEAAIITCLLDVNWQKGIQLEASGIMLSFDQWTDQIEGPVNEYEEYTYMFPDEATFLNTVQTCLVAVGRSDVSKLLEDATCRFGTTGSYSGWGNNHRQCTLYLTVPLKIKFMLTDALCEEIKQASNALMPKHAGFDVTDVEVSAELEPLPSDPEGEGLNVSSEGVAITPIFEYDGLRFRSHGEIEIYKVLKRSDVLFFPAAAAVLGGKGRKREPDFLICQKGKWGILEVMGNRYHTNENAAYDHARAEDFQKYGIKYIRFRTYTECMTNPKRVVEDFLRQLDEY